MARLASFRRITGPRLFKATRPVSNGRMVVAGDIVPCVSKAKSILVGIAAALIMLYARDLARAAYGVSHEMPTLAEFVVVTGWIVLDMVLLTFAFHHAMKRGYRPWSAALVSLLIASVVNVILDVGYGAARRAYPSLGLPTSEPGAPENAFYPFLTSFVDSAALLAIWTLAYLYPTAIRESRDREAEALHLRREMELYRLRTTLEPHFVRNTLNAIGAIMVEEPETARQLVGDLGALLSDRVHEKDEQQRTVEDELAWLQRYTAILETRHAGRLAFAWDVEPAARQCLVPALVLQPIIENAALHGALQRRSDGRVRIAGAIEASRLVFVVEDNGPGFPEGELREGARGLSMVRRRLALESPDATLEFENTGEGTRATLTLGAHTAS